MTSSILATGTSVPPHSISQTDALATFQDLACLDQRRRRRSKVMFDRAGVENRFMIVPHQCFYQWCADDQTPTEQITVGGSLTTVPDPIPTPVASNCSGLSTGQRMKLYDLYAADLANESAKKALESSGRAASSITHLVTVSCTGFASPGVDVSLIQSLGLPATVQRVNIGFMGCHAAVNGIRTAMNIVNADPAATVLVCCVELSSLHGRFEWGPDDDERIIGNALFADGSASLVIGSNEGKDDRAADWEIIDTGSVLIEDSESSLRWDIRDHGFEMIIENDIGDRIKSALPGWLSQWLNQRGLSFNDIDCWAVHPGGPKIISSVQSSLDLNDQQLSVSLDVLRRYGNMSSPTVLFILEEFRKAIAESTGNPSKTAKHGLIIAFGPGLMAEVALLKA